MSRLHVRPQAERGRVISVTPQNAGWRHVGFEVHELSAGESAAAATLEREVCLVLVSGKARRYSGHLRAVKIPRCPNVRTWPRSSGGAR